MKCQEFEPIIISMARGQLVEAAAREMALAHLERCVRCVTAFSEQQAITAGMRVVAENLGDQGASARVEEALRQAFREQASQFSAHAIKLRWPRWTVGLAAAILLLALLAGMDWLKSLPANQKQVADNLPATHSGEGPGQKQTSQARSDGQMDQNQKIRSGAVRSRAHLHDIEVGKMKGSPRKKRQPGAESSGQRAIECVLCEGRRATSTIHAGIPAGGIGNELPIAMVNEQWYSPELQVFALTKQNDPRTGETIYRLTSINRSEPTPALFEVPANSPLRDATLRADPSIKRRRPEEER
jgi:hypothetical protein